MYNLWQTQRLREGEEKEEKEEFYFAKQILK